MSYNKVTYNSEYNKKNYTELKFRVKKGQEEIIKEHWKSNGYKSLSSYVNYLINADMAGGLAPSRDKNNTIDS